MARCANCGNEYDKTFQVTTHAGETYDFDSFECAIHTVAPRCENCDTRVVGHGVEVNGNIYCCSHCATRAGYEGTRDRVRT